MDYSQPCGAAVSSIKKLATSRRSVKLKGRSGFAEFSKLATFVNTVAKDKAKNPKKFEERKRQVAKDLGLSISKNGIITDRTNRTKNAVQKVQKAKKATDASLAKLTKRRDELVARRQRKIDDRARESNRSTSNANLRKTISNLEKEINKVSADLDRTKRSVRGKRSKARRIGREAKAKFPTL